MPRSSVVSIEVEPLSIPLREPFVIATGRIDTTRAALVRATLEDEGGRRATGLGEAAALPPVTREDQPDLLAAIAAAAPALRGAAIAGVDDVAALVARALPDSSVARAGVEAAILDGWARLTGRPLFAALGAGADAATELITDITLPISDPERMAAGAAAHRRAGFTCFKVKVGRDGQADLASLRAVAGGGARTPASGWTPTRASRRARRSRSSTPRSTTGCTSNVTSSRAPPTISPAWRRSPPAHRCRWSPTNRFAPPPISIACSRARAAQAVNLKLGKLGGPLATLALARRARAAGLRLMAGAMVETRVGLLAMAHVVAALGGVDWIDLDTAFLLADDPFHGGWSFDGPRLRLAADPGLGVTAAADLV